MSKSVRLRRVCKTLSVLDGRLVILVMVVIGVVLIMWQKSRVSNGTKNIATVLVVITIDVTLRDSVFVPMVMSAMVMTTGSVAA